jgi:hypothetical protein
MFPHSLVMYGKELDRNSKLQQQTRAVPHKERIKIIAAAFSYSF